MKKEIEEYLTPTTVITTDKKYSEQWYITKVIDGIYYGKVVEYEWNTPEIVIPSGKYYIVSVTVGEYDTLICGPQSVEKTYNINISNEDK